MTRILSPIDGVAYRPAAEAERWYANGGWVRATLGDALRATAARHPDKPAVVSDERTITFAELDATTDRLAAALLDLGLATGDRALFQMGTTVETVVALIACFKAGVVPVCTLPQHREVEIGELARQSGARGYFVQADVGRFDLVGFAAAMMERHPALAHLVVARGNAGPGAALDDLVAGTTPEAARRRLAGLPLGPEDVMVFQLSGGTTGLPKIIPRFHAEYLGHVRHLMGLYGMTADSRILWSLPILHNAAQVYALVPMILGGPTMVMMPRVDIVRMLELVEEQRVTHALSVGPIAPQLMGYTGIARHDLSSLRLFATMSRADKLEEHLGVPCSNLFGITEGLLLGSGPDAPAERRHRTQGASGCPHDEIRLLEPGSEREVPLGQMGELCFRGPSSLTGYVGNPAANAAAFTADGFYRTGDIMTAHRIDGRLCYAFEGRLRDNINRGGEKIGCEEVEAYVSRHPSVADAKLVAMPDPLYGEKACVFIVTRPGRPPPDVGELADFLTGCGLAKYKCPERVEVIDEFPLTRVGKLDKPALKRLVADKLAAEAATAGAP
ncbi:AMP-binding protein [Azospirillum sp. ST 5-10]|uniref:AMP-binding protein n=1 Tax=unclassified Azospirillum TaxID=2630922 RepID=UPI003F4A3E14